MTTINSFFDHVYVITCSDTMERQDKVSKHMSERQISFSFMYSWDKKFFSNHIRDASKKSLQTSHIRCILDAKINKFKNILICEDDVWIIQNYESEFDPFIKNLPEDWEYLQLGNQFWADRFLKRNKVNDNVYRFFWGTGSHCCGIKETSYDITCQTFEKFYDNTDFMYYHIFSERPCYCPKKFIANALSRPDPQYINDIENANQYVFDSKIVR